MKSGRKKKPGLRYGKNGRLTRAARRANEVAQQEDTMETAIDARRRHYDVSRSAAKQPDMGFPLGRLRKWDYISQPQYEAGTKFADAMRAYLSSKIGKGATVSAQDLDRHGASLTERPVQREDEARAYIEALAELDRQHSRKRSTTSIIWEICLTEHAGQMDQGEIGAMREGLNAIDRVIKRRERLARRVA